jgi:tetratricopeptide (TPR) repeat protein
MKNYILSLLLLTMAMSATAQISRNGSGISVNPVTPPVTGATAHLTDPSSYNISRGLDEISKGHYDKAVSYINKELEDDDENGQAYLLLSDIYYQQGQYGDALQNASNALNSMSNVAFFII